MKIERSKQPESQAVRLTLEDFKEYESFKNILNSAKEFLERIPYGLRHSQMKIDLDFVNSMIKEV